MEQSLDLRDLARRMPAEVRFPEPTRHSLASERLHSTGSISSNHHSSIVVVDTEVRQAHLHVRLSDFGSTSLEDFQNGAVRTMMRALQTGGGNGRIDPGTTRRYDLIVIAVVTTIIIVGIAMAAGHPIKSFGLTTFFVLLVFALTIALIWGFKRVSVARAAERSADAVFRNCRLVVLAESGHNSQGRMPTAPEDFDYILQGYGKSGTLSIVSSRELGTIRLVQLLKFADKRASVYLDTPPGRALLGTLLPAATEAIAVAV